MKRSIPILLCLGLASAAVAQVDDLPGVEDLDLSGDWSMAELQAVWPDLTEDGFTAIDADGSGAVDVGELQTAWENGVLKAPAEG